MSNIKTYRQRKPILGCKRSPKITYMAGNRDDDRMFNIVDGRMSDFGHIHDTKITLDKIFENQSYLAHNHWVGVFRITYVNNWPELGVLAGDFDQYVVDVAAGKDDVVEKIQRKLLKELEDQNIDIGCNWVDLIIKSINTRNGILKVDTANQIR